MSGEVKGDAEPLLPGLDIVSVEFVGFLHR